MLVTARAGAAPPTAHGRRLPASARPSATAVQPQVRHELLEAVEKARQHPAGNARPPPAAQQRSGTVQAGTSLAPARLARRIRVWVTA